MKSLVLLCVIAGALGQVQQSPQPIQPVRSYASGLNDVPILSFANDNNYDGSYKYSYETGNGINVQEEGYLKNPGQEDIEAQVARGSYSYTAPDGQVITVNWYADETGFHAEGTHIPAGSSPAVGPPIAVAQGRPKSELPAPFELPESAVVTNDYFRG